MQHLYQIPDCTTSSTVHAQEETVLRSRQTSLQNTDFPEAQSSEALGYLLSRASALPFYVSPQFLAYIQEVSKNLHTAVTDIVSGWWKDPELSTAIPLEPKIERLLRRLETEGIAWRSGSWRPDFLIERRTDDGNSFPRLRICEINARFGFNGFFCCQAIARYFKDDTSIFQPAIPNFFETFRHAFDMSKPVHVLKGREAGYDIHHLANVLGTSVMFAEPSQLRTIRAGTRHILVQILDGKEIEVFQIVSELHQDEICSLSEDLLWEVSIRICINDIRTIMLVHDKRMLAIIRQKFGDLVSRKVLTASAAASLRDAIAETYLPGSLEYQHALESERNEKWLFKPAGGGKGAGIVFRDDIPENDWRAFVATTNMSHVLQRAVNHQRFDLIMPDDNSVKHVSWNIVGTFFIVDGCFGGFGPWRSSEEKICALSRGGSWMIGVCNRSLLPFSMHTPLGLREIRRLSQTISERSEDVNIFPPKTIEAHSTHCGSAADHVAKVRQSLEEHGVALVKLNFEDPSSSYLVSLVRDGFHPLYGHGLPVNHSRKKGWLWDVKPIHGKTHTVNDPLARSETMEIFPWHTDCSFERNPPRHFALHILHADRYGGGSLSLVRTSDIIQELSEETVSGLARPEFIFAVPDEFNKDTSPTLVGSLLDMSFGEPKIRYRRDIIVPMTSEAEAALNELDSVLETCKSSSGRSLKKVMKAEDLPDGMLIVIDNAKWLHARSQVNDLDRHLRRVRWNAQPFPVTD